MAQQKGGFSMELDIRVKNFLMLHPMQNPEVNFLKMTGVEVMLTQLSWR